MIFFIIIIYYKKFMSDEKEVWRDIDGYDGDYKVSNWGRVKSYKYDKVNGKIRKEKNNGRLYVNLCDNGKVKCFYINRLVALAFIPNPNNFPEAAHRDGNPLNNHVSNLKWRPREEDVRNKKGWSNTGILGLNYHETKNRTPCIRAQYRNKEGKYIVKTFTINANPTRCKNAKEGEYGYCYLTREAAEEAGKKWLKDTRDVEFPDVYIQCYLKDG
jgi:hypothetical protein